MNINITFKPTKEIAQAAIEVSEQIAAKHDVYFTLNQTNHLPHITILQTEIEPEDLQPLQDQLQEEFHSLDPITIRFTDIEAVLGWVGVNVKKTSTMLAIRQTISDYLQLTEETPYKPHLTFTRLKHEQEAEQLSAQLKWAEVSFVCSEMGIYLVSDHGVCINELATLKLG